MVLTTANMDSSKRVDINLRMKNAPLIAAKKCVIITQAMNMGRMILSLLLVDSFGGYALGHVKTRRFVFNGFIVFSILSFSKWLYEFDNNREYTNKAIKYYVLYEYSIW